MKEITDYSKIKREFNGLPRVIPASNYSRLTHWQLNCDHMLLAKPLLLYLSPYKYYHIPFTNVNNNNFLYY